MSEAVAADADDCYDIMSRANREEQEEEGKERRGEREKWKRGRKEGMMIVNT